MFATGNDPGLRADEEGEAWKDSKLVTLQRLQHWGPLISLGLHQQLRWPSAQQELDEMTSKQTRASLLLLRRSTCSVRQQTDDGKPF